MKWKHILLVLGFLLVISSTGFALRDAPAPWLRELCESTSSPLSNKIYWVDFVTDTIERANLDGSGRKPLVTIGFRRPSTGIALDIADGKMYWSNFHDVTIERANLDGSGREPLVTSVGGADVIAIDVVSRKMYWGNFVTDTIERANFDGSGREPLVTTGLDAPTGIALDVAGGKMYWTDYGTGRIERANLDGSGRESLVTSLEGVNGIALQLGPTGR